MHAWRPQWTLDSAVCSKHEDFLGARMNEKHKLVSLKRRRSLTGVQNFGNLKKFDRLARILIILVPLFRSKKLTQFSRTSDEGNKYSIWET